MITVGNLYREMVRLAKAGWLYVASYMIVISGGFSFADVFAYDQDALYFLLAITSWVAGYALFVGLMFRGGYCPEGSKSGVGTYFVLGLATGIAIGMGLIALILPGLYLMVRWLPSFSRALVTDEGVGAAMRWSWDNTEDHVIPLSIVFAPAVICYLGSLAMFFGYEEVFPAFDDTSYTVTVVIANTLQNLGIVLTTLLGNAVYGLLVDDRRRAEDVFG